MTSPRVQWMNSMLIGCFSSHNKPDIETKIKEDSDLRTKINAFLAGKSGQVLLVYCQKPYKTNDLGERVEEVNGMYQICVNEGNVKNVMF